MTWGRAATAIAIKDLRIEWRGRTAVISAIAFAVLVQLVFVFARDSDAVTLPAVAPAVLWVMLALSSLLALNRAFALERDNAAFEALLLAPIARSEIFWGKWAGNTILVFGVQCLAFPVWVMFFNVTPATAGWLATIVAFTVPGFTAVGTLLAAMTRRTRHADALLPVMLLPFVLIPIFFAAQATRAVLAARASRDILGQMELLALYDVVFLTAATLIFPAVVDE